jgi:hypothetical protein
MHRLYVKGDHGIEEANEDMDIPWKPVGHERIAKGNVTICQKLWRTFVRSFVAMAWIEHGYALL